MIKDQKFRKAAGGETLTSLTAHEGLGKFLSETQNSVSPISLRNDR